MFAAEIILDQENQLIRCPNRCTENSKYTIRNTRVCMTLPEKLDYSIVITTHYIIQDLHAGVPAQRRLCLGLGGREAWRDVSFFQLGYSSSTKPSMCYQRLAPADAGEYLTYFKYSVRVAKFRGANGACSMGTRK